MVRRLALEPHILNRYVSLYGSGACRLPCPPTTYSVKSSHWGPRLKRGGLGKIDMLLFLWLESSDITHRLIVLCTSRADSSPSSPGVPRARAGSSPALDSTRVGSSLLAPSSWRLEQGSNRRPRADSTLLKSPD